LQDGGKKYPGDVKVKQSNFDEEEEYHDELARLGQFAVLENLYKYIPDARDAKAHLDHVIDLCGTPPQGKQFAESIMYRVIQKYMKTKSK
jgi:Holliday junction resolvasome RuvABC ATP-dependent DNA helicase subunit